MSLHLRLWNNREERWRRDRSSTVVFSDGDSAKVEHYTFGRRSTEYSPKKQLVRYRLKLSVPEIKLIAENRLHTPLHEVNALCGYGA